MLQELTPIITAFLVLVETIVICIVIPFFLIRSIIRMWKNRKNINIKKYVYWPLLFLCAVPGFCVFTASQEDNLESPIGRFWLTILFVAFIITMVWSIIQYKFAGLWVGFIRFFLGFFIGVLASVLIFLALGLLLLLGLGSGSSVYIIKDGESCYLNDTGDAETYSDKDGNLYRIHNGAATDSHGYSYHVFGIKK